MKMNIEKCFTLFIFRTTTFDSKPSGAASRPLCRCVAQEEEEGVEIREREREKTPTTLLFTLCPQFIPAIIRAGVEVFHCDGCSL